MTASTFADYATQADARQSIADAVLRHTQALCEALRQNYIDYSIQRHQRALDTLTGKERAHHQFSIAELKAGKCDYSFIIESGTKYHKIIMVIDNGPDRSPSRSVHAFVSRKTGELYKSASWKSPAKGVRYDMRIIQQREQMLANCDWAGGYLYAR